MKGEIKERKDAGGVVINQKSMVALISYPRYKNEWFFPKGGLEKGETALAAARREIYEEAGIRDLKFIKNLGSYKRFDLTDNKNLLNIKMFLFYSEMKNLKTKTPSEIDKVRWADKKRVCNLLFCPEERRFFLKNKNKF